MPVKKIKPTSPGRRFYVANDLRHLSKEKPEKSLLRPLKKKAGRNNDGRITVHSRGGGHKRKYRLVDFQRKKVGVPGQVRTIEYDPVRSAFIMLVVYRDGEKLYLIAPKGIEVGNKIEAGDDVAPTLGNAMPIRKMPMGAIIHNVELEPGRGACLVRSAGAYAQIVSREGNHTAIKLPSGEMRLINNRCMATMGAVSNSEHHGRVIGKAGRNRWLGKRPHTRGIAKNPCDHPNGGGEGKGKGGKLRSPTGKPKGLVTRKAKKASRHMILKRRK